MEETLLKLTPDMAGMPITAAEYAEADWLEPYRFERVKGRLVVVPPAGPGHRRVSRPFRRELGGYWQAHPDIVEDVDVEACVSTGGDGDRISDIAIYLVDPQCEETIPSRIPDLIFEFVSKSRADQERDYIHKRGEYHLIGVKEYVIVDRLKRKVLVLTWTEDGYEERELREDDVYASPLLAGLEVRLSDVFAGE